MQGLLSLSVQHSHTRWGALAGHIVNLLAIAGQILLRNPQILPAAIAKEIFVVVVLILVLVLVVR